MARAIQGKRKRRGPAVIKRSRKTQMERCIEEGKQFVKSYHPRPISLPAPVPPVYVTKKRVSKKKVVSRRVLPKKVAVPKRAAPMKVRPAKKSKPKKSSLFGSRPAGSLFGGSSIPAPSSGSIFGGGLFGSSGGTLTTATTFATGKKPEEIVPVDVTKIGGGKHRTSSRDHLPMGAYGIIDICFCLDATGSMSSELAQAKSTINNLIEKLTDKVRIEGITIRFGVVAYHDHMDTPLLRIQDLTDAKTAINFTNGLYAMGGGDEPEAVHDAIQAACKRLSWAESPSTPMVRYIFHVLDAPPHGKQFDNYETQEGCKCGISTDQILHQMNLRQIHYRMIKVRANPKVDKMQQIFKKKLGNFDSADIAHAGEMDVRVSDMVIHEVMPDM